MDEEMTINRLIGYGEFELKPNQLGLKDKKQETLKIVKNAY
jgi:hypothetical protein